MQIVVREILNKYGWEDKIDDEETILNWKRDFLGYGFNYENFNQSIIFLREYANYDKLDKDEHGNFKHNYGGVDYGSDSDSCSTRKYKCIGNKPCKDTGENCTWHTKCGYYGLDCFHDCKCPRPKKTLKDYIIYDKLLSDITHSKLKHSVVSFSRNTPVDWHPGSNNKVRDIVHPSMYPYIRGKTSVKEESYVGHITGNSEISYQWLPSELTKVNDKFEFSSYINNLPETEVDLKNNICNAFNELIPSFSKIIDKDLTRKQNLQVIVKIGSINLSTENIRYLGGEWHKEGMSHENIVATAVHYILIENIEDSTLRFKKPYPKFNPSRSYPQNDIRYIDRHYDVEDNDMDERTVDVIFNKDLGSIECKETYTVVFPNTLIHKVGTCDLSSGKNLGYRTILAFFLINPDKRIISTKDVDPQQNHINLDDAKLYREKLMEERGFGRRFDDRETKVRFTLCEH